MICPSHEIARLLSQDWFGGRPRRPDIVRFVSVLSRVPRLTPELPFALPSQGQWLLESSPATAGSSSVSTRRHMKAIGYLGTLDRLFGASATTRNWNTITAISKALERV